MRKCVHARRVSMLTGRGKPLHDSGPQINLTLPCSLAGDTVASPKHCIMQGFPHASDVMACAGLCTGRTRHWESNPAEPGH